jgi:flagellar biosynthesis/type III secretory pathway chaperone
MSAAVASTHAADLAEMAEQLIELMGRESAALRRFAFAEASALTEGKATLANVFASRMTALRKQPQSLRPSDAAARRRLATAARALQQAAIDNALALRAAHDAHHSLLNAVVQAVTKRDTPPAGYGRNGRSQAPNRGPVQPVSLFQDRRF